MFEHLDFEHFLEPFNTPIKATLTWPEQSDLDGLIALFKEFFNSDDLTLHPHELHPTQHLPTQTVLITLQADPCKTPLYLSLPPACQTRLLQQFFGPDQTFHDPRLKEGALYYIVAQFLDRFNGAHLLSKLTVYLADEQPCHESLQQLKCELSWAKSTPVTFDLFFPESLVETLDQLYKHRAASNNLPCLIHIHTGSVKLTQQQLSGLKPKELVILDENYYQPDTQKGLGYLYFKTTCFAQVRINEHHFKFLDFNPLPDEALMEHSDQSPLVTLETTQLNLQVEFATLTLPFKDLEQLTPGQTLDFHKDDPAKVYLTLQGQKIAKGKLVKIGDGMAFLVEQIKHDS